ncbi:protein prenylyltransferase [Pseudomassariella vexata]|uniref:Protein farnesyltransferase/geranylgeranyltransferase type-1 subunit alpha n=1 Tax=Pseudomassariella vexata TaxID=1141098 RepID=A0A1Y2EK71_9PEZI|nr:protein prenylyltransferase [Pseudomassariella vexata]ORY71706.1 protein prenylyltransferase [Pseudomassariella vexata]
MSQQKRASKAKTADSTGASKEPKTVYEDALHTYYLTRPFDRAYEGHGLDGMSAVDKQGWITQQSAQPGVIEELSKKTQKEILKQVSDLGIPVRRAHIKPTPDQWGKDKHGRNIGDYTLEERNVRFTKQSKLRKLTSASDRFRNRRDLVLSGLVDGNTGEPFTLEDGAVEKERVRRKEMAALKDDLYGEKRNSYSMDPDWDDVVPIPQSEPEGALAAISYPEDYAESMSYLRAVMAAQEYSPRCLKLTEDIIFMNPAHYTVWLYRFSIVQALKISILEELAWLNNVALEHLKNYQIWHHRQLLIDHYYPSIADAPDDIKILANSERDFLMQMFAEDAKNYHVWSYRQYIVHKLSMWDQVELQSIEGMIDEDVRNNSAWSHRFFLVFSNPSYATEDSHSTEHDPKVPAEIIDREIRYAQEKIKLAPQNQSPWNYLRGVLVKGGRKLGSVKGYVEEYVKDLGEESEAVRSSHALDQLADTYKEAGDKEKADLCLRRLGEKWDRIRQGYWEYRRQTLEV